MSFFFCKFSIEKPNIIIYIHDWMYTYSVDIVSENECMYKAHTLNFLNLYALALSCYIFSKLWNTIEIFFKYLKKVTKKNRCRFLFFFVCLFLTCPFFPFFLFSFNTNAHFKIFILLKSYLNEYDVYFLFLFCNYITTVNELGEP